MTRRLELGTFGVRMAFGACVLACSPVLVQAQAGEPALRGITVGPIESSQQPGRGYGTAYSAELLDELVRLGANAISITPFGRIWSLQSTEILFDFEAPYPENRAAIGEMIAQAKARGLRVLLIPHLWVETGGWRGEIDPGSEEGWLRYQDAYRRFVLAWAKDAQRYGADAFSIGVECKSWSGRFGGYWSGLIAELRSVFAGRLTYSANWDEAEDVAFWDQLDWVGVNAFYPLAHADNASDEEYRRNAELALERLRELSESVQKPVVMVEIGYTTRANAAVQPWLWPDTMQNVIVDEREQARALAALAGAAASHEFVRGLFVWRYYSNLDDVSQEAIWGFSPHGKLAEPVLERIFGLPWAADPVRPPWEPVPLAPRDRWPERLWE
ncbi:MAG TPA: hypothetical protein VK509_24570 [Polyangiales bacterium]|nr:hypothetical protein [Polyangiales bacterium]